MTEPKLALAADRQQLKLSELMLIQLFPQQQMMARGADNLLRLLTANISKTSWQLTTTFFFFFSIPAQKLLLSFVSAAVYKLSFAVKWDERMDINQTGGSRGQRRQTAGVLGKK